MDWFYSLYTAIEKTFFNTLSKKIAGNIGFLTIIFWLAMYFAYPDNGTGSVWWTIFIVGSGAFFFTIGYLIYLIVRPVQALITALHEANQRGTDLNHRLPAFTYDEFRNLSDEYNQFVAQLGQLMTGLHQ